MKKKYEEDTKQYMEIVSKHEAQKEARRKARKSWKDTKTLATEDLIRERGFFLSGLFFLIGSAIASNFLLSALRVYHPSKSLQSTLGLAPLAFYAAAMALFIYLIYRFSKPLEPKLVVLLLIGFSAVIFISLMRASAINTALWLEFAGKMPFPQAEKLGFTFDEWLTGGQDILDKDTIISIFLTLGSKAFFVYLVYRLSRFLHRRTGITVVLCVLAVIPILYLVPIISLLTDVRRARQAIASGQKEEN